LPDPIHGSVVEARLRLATIETRDISGVSAGSGAYEFVGGVPAYVAFEFATAACAKSVLANVLPSRPLPPYGMRLQTPLFATGVSAAPQASEAAAVSETDFDGGWLRRRLV